jgi:N-acetylglutamate synthase-like GNAT family acetyltransferase
MPLIRTGYRETFEEIWSEDPRLGRVCLLAWDSETFGFPVASFQVGADELDEGSLKEFSVRFSRWARENDVVLCSCRIPATNRFWKAYLPEAGFRFIDFGLRASLPNLSRISLPDARVELRVATADDYDAIEGIAGEAFHHGRYHADLLFPTRLANLRYRDWVRRALEATNGIDRVYVMGHRGAVHGFYHVTVEGTVSDLRLAAISPELQGTILGFGLYVSMLHVLRGLGVRRAVTSISAANTSVMNVYSTLGFRFSDPEAFYHWHSEKMPSLVNG